MTNKILITSAYILILLTISCERSNKTYDHLSRDYWYNTGLIESRSLPFYFAINPKITDYAANDDFIVAEQKPEKKMAVAFMGEPLFRRFEYYKLYKKDPNMLNDSFYRKLKGVVEKDSTLYAQFLNLGASNNELQNMEIGIRLAEQLLVEDKIVKKIYDSKVNYWIIITAKDSILGPLKREEYLSIKNSLGVPENLKLEFEK